MTGTEAEEHLHTLATAAVWNLATPAVIRPHRDGWLIFMRGQYAWYGTAGPAADALLTGQHTNGLPAGSSKGNPSSRTALVSPRPGKEGCQA